MKLNTSSEITEDKLNEISSKDKTREQKVSSKLIDVAIYGGVGGVITLIWFLALTR